MSRSSGIDKSESLSYLEELFVRTVLLIFVAAFFFFASIFVGAFVFCAELNDFLSPFFSPRLPPFRVALLLAR